MNQYQQQQKAERNKKIFQEYHKTRKGISYRILGKDYNLTGARIEQIVNGYARKIAMGEAEE